MRLQVPILALRIKTSVKSGGEDLKVPSTYMVSMTEVVTASRTSDNREDEDSVTI